MVEIIVYSLYWMTQDFYHQQYQDVPERNFVMLIPHKYRPHLLMRSSLGLIIFCGFAYLEVQGTDNWVITLLVCQLEPYGYSYGAGCKYPGAPSMRFQRLPCRRSAKAERLEPRVASGLRGRTLRQERRGRAWRRFQRR